MIRTVLLATATWSVLLPACESRGQSVRAAFEVDLRATTFIGSSFLLNPIDIYDIYVTVDSDLPVTAIDWSVSFANIAPRTPYAFSSVSKPLGTLFEEPDTFFRLPSRVRSDERGVPLPGEIVTSGVVDSLEQLAANFRLADGSAIIEPRVRTPIITIMTLEGNDLNLTSPDTWGPVEINGEWLAITLVPEPTSALTLLGLATLLSRRRGRSPR